MTRNNTTSRMKKRDNCGTDMYKHEKTIDDYSEREEDYTMCSESTHSYR